MNNSSLVDETKPNIIIIDGKVIEIPIFEVATNPSFCMRCGVGWEGPTTMHPYAVAGGRRGFVLMHCEEEDDGRISHSRMHEAFRGLLCSERD